MLKSLLDEAPGGCADPHQVARLVVTEHGGRIPDDLRARAWGSLLGVAVTRTSEGHTSHLSEAIASTELDLSNQRVVRVDADRTRQEMAEFRTEERKLRLQRLLTFYCRSHSIPYRQGMNEVVAPLLWLRPSGGDSKDTLPDDVVYSLLQRIVTKLAPSAYAEDSDFVALQCSLRFLRLLLQYHDPELSLCLDQCDCPPELYATPWLITLFARGAPPGAVLYIWDWLLMQLAEGEWLEGEEEKEEEVLWGGKGFGSSSLHFLVVAFLVEHRGKILEAARNASGGPFAPSELPIVLTRLSMDEAVAVRVCALGSKLAQSTPLSAREELSNKCYGPIPPSEETLKEIEAHVVLRVSPAEALSAALHGEALARASETSTDKSVAEQEVRFLLVDCREMADFAGAHVRPAFHLDPGLLLRPEALGDAMTAFGSMPGAHFAVMGAGRGEDSETLSHSEAARRVALAEGRVYEADEVTKVVLLYFLQKGFRYVAEVDGGFDGLLRALPSMSREAASMLVGSDGRSGEAGEGRDAPSSTTSSSNLSLAARFRGRRTMSMSSDRGRRRLAAIRRWIGDSTAPSLPSTVVSLTPEEWILDQHCETLLGLRRIDQRFNDMPRAVALAKPKRQARRTRAWSTSGLPEPPSSEPATPASFFDAPTPKSTISEPESKQQQQQQHPKSFSAASVREAGPIVTARESAAVLNGAVPGLVVAPALLGLAIEQIPHQTAPATIPGGCILGRWDHDTLAPPDDAAPDAPVCIALPFFRGEARPAIPPKLYGAQTLGPKEGHEEAAVSIRRLVALTDDTFTVLQPIQPPDGTELTPDSMHFRVERTFPLSQLRRVSGKRKHPNLALFVLRSDEKIRLHLDDFQAVVQALRTSATESAKREK